ncbi:MAG: hypothetical protein K2X08_03960 [Chlamydiales bacterium]|nr:hypothetical protein [Chlamydiales bacterium]
MKWFLTLCIYFSSLNAEETYRNNMKNRFLEAPALLQNFCLCSNLASGRNSLLQTKKSEELSCQNPDLSSSFNMEEKTSICYRIQSIPFEERKILERFFRRLFCHADFSYTLFGLKSMGSIDYNLDLLSFPQFYKEPEKHLFLMALDEKGWRIWERYKNLFPMEKYAFIKVRHDTCFSFLLINKEKAYSVLEKNLLLFQELLLEKVCANELLKRICEGQLAYSHSNTPCLVAYYKALGLLYGYGEENVRDFIKREQILQDLKNLPIDLRKLPPEVVNCLERIENEKTGAKFQHNFFLGVTSLVSEFKNLVNKTHLIKGTKREHSFLPIKRSSFFGSEEYPQTQVIVKNYDELNSMILKIFESGSLLETVLGMLTSS